MIFSGEIYSKDKKMGKKVEEDTYFYDSINRKSFSALVASKKNFIATIIVAV